MATLPACPNGEKKRGWVWKREGTWLKLLVFNKGGGRRRGAQVDMSRREFVYMKPDILWPAISNHVLVLELILPHVNLVPRICTYTRKGREDKSKRGKEEKTTRTESSRWSR